MTTIKIWDVPVRLFHWGMVTCLIVSYWSIENAYFEIHEKSGLILLCLLVFRILWGFVGSETARFGQFLKPPGTVLRYSSDLWNYRSQPSVGHSPLGGYAVMVLLAALFVQVVLGLLSQTEFGVFEGPWSDIVREEQSLRFTEWHEDFFDILLLLGIVHVAMVAAYFVWQSNDLIGPMVTGKKELEVDQPNIAPWRRMLLVGAAAVAIGWGGVGLVEAIFA